MKLFVQLVAIGVICSGCATVPEAPPPPVVSVLRHRTLTLAPGQVSTITHGKVTITVTPVPPEEPVRSFSERDTQPQCKTLFQSGSANCLCGQGPLCFDRIKYPVYQQSDGISFDVSIKSDIHKPIRLGDSLVAFRNGTEQIPYSYYQESINTFQKNIILPGSVVRSSVQGPRNLLHNVGPGEKVNIVLGFYDIPVEMNDNSIVTKKAQFEYKFNYSYTEEQKFDSVEVEHMHTVP